MKLFDLGEVQAQTKAQVGDTFDSLGDNHQPPG
jgi:hypothetical protein